MKTIGFWENNLLLQEVTLKLLVEKCCKLKMGSNIVNDSSFQILVDKLEQILNTEFLPEINEKNISLGSMKITNLRFIICKNNTVKLNNTNSNMTGCFCINPPNIKDICKLSLSFPLDNSASSIYIPISKNTVTSFVTNSDYFICNKNDDEPIWFIYNADYINADLTTKTNYDWILEHINIPAAIETIKIRDNFEVDIQNHLRYFRLQDDAEIIFKKTNFSTELNIINLLLQNTGRIWREKSIKFAVNKIDDKRGCYGLLIKKGSINNNIMNFICAIYNFDRRQIDFNYRNIVEIGPSDDRTKFYFVIHELIDNKIRKIIHGYEKADDIIYKRVYIMNKTNLVKISMNFPEINLAHITRGFNDYGSENSMTWEKRDYRMGMSVNAFQTRITPSQQFNTEQLEILLEIIYKLFGTDREVIYNNLKSILFEDITHIALTKVRNRENEFTIYYGYL